MEGQQQKTGDFVRIALTDGSFGYGRLLERPYAAFYNYRTTDPDADLEGIASQPILFKMLPSTLDEGEVGPGEQAE